MLSRTHTFTIIPLMYTFVFFCYILSNWVAEVPFYPQYRYSCLPKLVTFTANHLSSHRLFSTFKIPIDPNFNVDWMTCGKSKSSIALNVNVIEEELLYLQVVVLLILAHIYKVRCTRKLEDQQRLLLILNTHSGLLAIPK